MLVCIDSFKIQIISQMHRSDGWTDIEHGRVISSAYPEITRDNNGTINQIFVQGCNSSQNRRPLLIRNNCECCFVLNKLKQFCEHNKEPFEIVGGGIKLND